MAPLLASAGDFSVAPIRMFLDKERKSSVVTITNNGTEPLRFEIKPKEWTQDVGGKDVYLDTNDLLVFPRLMTLDGREDRDIRIGMKIPPGDNEKTYRVFINELPPSTPPGTTGADAANVGFLINFAMPVFFAPINPEAALVISRLSLANGEVRVGLSNTGNVFQFVQEMSIAGLDASGQEIFREPVAERYILAGGARSYGQAVPPDQCDSLAVIKFSVRTDKMSANEKKNVDRQFCNSRSPESSSADTSR
ncbi:MAG: fimbria/pilus periplasmic chaperone [Burkholderiales bacterium]